MELYRSTYAEIDLNKIKNNYFSIKEHIGEHANIMPVVKADAYGHGAVPVAKALVEAGANYFAVSSLEEALELRHAGIKKPILIFGCISPSYLDIAVKHEFTVTVCDSEIIELLDKLAKSQQKIAKFHVKIDTGMGRVGINDIQIFEKVIIATKESENVMLEGIYTHFANSDAVDKEYSKLQYDNFQKYLQLAKQLSNKPLIHVSNSGAIIDNPEFSYDYVRAGISLYGCYPSPNTRQTKLKLSSAMMFKTEISFLKEVAAGSYIGYGSTFQTKRLSKIATLPVGYADGFNRLLSNCGYVLVNSAKAPIIGRVCMDQTIIDVTDIADVNIGDEVVLFGSQNNAVISVDEIADLTQTINYEVLCAISKRVPRVYL